MKINLDRLIDAILLRLLCNPVGGGGESSRANRTAGRARVESYLYYIHTLYIILI